ncbi:MAG: WD40/YVTN/BNR-like repeat-containing protein [Chitinophagales bacterium]
MSNKFSLIKAESVFLYQHQIHGRLKRQERVADIPIFVKTMLKYCLMACLLLFQTRSARAQKLRILSLGNTSSLRGLCAVDDRVIWVCGSAGTVGISADAGVSWRWIAVAHYEKADFRDVEAFSDQEAVIMGVTDPSVILKTKDGGKSWLPVFQDSSKAMFLDAVDFSGDQGILLGDPVDHKIFLAETKDRGDSWKIIENKDQRRAAPGEAFFAASGSNIKWMPNHHYALVSGGGKSTLYVDSSGYFPLLLAQGKETTGANSIAMDPSDPNHAYITGGDFSNDRLDSGNALSIRFHPFQQRRPGRAPHGYRSCVEYLDSHKMICCGTSGVDISEDGGMNWTLISSKSFHVCRKAKSGKCIFLAGGHGIIALLEW